MKLFFFCSFLYCVFAYDDDLEGLVKPNVEHDYLDNHILTVTVRNGDYNRVIDTKTDEIIVGLRDEINPPINAVVCNFFGQILNIDPKLISVIHGHSENERKTIQIDGEAITSDQIVNRILIALRDSIEEERFLKPSIKHRVL